MLELFFDNYSLYIFVIAGLLAGVPAVWIHRDRAGVRSVWGVVLLCVIYSVSSVLCAMLFAKLEGWISGVDGGNISTYGIYLIGPFILLLASVLLRLRPAGVMDIFALYAMPSLFLMRCHCLVWGCCSGLPFFDTGLRWPTRESEMIFYVLMFIMLWKKLRKNEMPGQLFPLLMISYGCFRFVNQWFRDTGSTGFHMSHGWSVLCALIGLALFLRVRAQAKKK
ncbi:MAG: prolipoprotein diacylglyceryl transferase [Lachnospiraceae bacterium]|nr:prolipoprotein diacylglyceryl transferase [Lachnospiraceae bacterium]